MTELDSKVNLSSNESAPYTYVDDQVSTSNALLIEKMNKDKEEMAKKLYDLNSTHL